jgi:transposase
VKRFIAGEDRQQITLLPDCLDDYITADNPVRLVEVFVDELDLTALGFAGAMPEATGRPAYHPATLLKICTAISTASRRAGGSNARASAISSWSG